MSDTAKPTYEQLEWMVNDRERQRDEARQKHEGERARNRRLELVLRGLTDEQFHLNVTISPDIFNQNTHDAVQALLKNYVGHTAHAIEEKLGGPLRRFQEALMHIHYLENHARSRGVEFSPFEVRERDRWLYY